MQLTLRRVVPGASVAYSAWLDHGRWWTRALRWVAARFGHPEWPRPIVTVAKLTQRQHDAFAIEGGAVGEPLGRPTPTARFIMAGGGMLALDTKDGWPEPGDCWVAPDDSGKKRVHVAADWLPMFTWAEKRASDPGRGRQSRLSGTRVSCWGSRPTFPAALAKRLDKLARLVAKLDEWGGVLVEPITGVIYNHRSITWDNANENSFSGTTTVTISLAVAVQANRYLLGMVNYSGNNRTISTMAFDSVDMGSALASDTQTNVNMGVFGIVAPNTGTKNLLITMSGATGGAGLATSYYGVDQATPHGTAAKAKGTTGNPTVNVTSQPGGMVVDLQGDIQSLGGTYTVGGSQTERKRSTATGVVSRSITSDQAGAASVTMSGSHTSSEWQIIAVPLNPDWLPWDLAHTPQHQTAMAM